MIISCPQCETSFAIADEVYKPGRKARCSQCGFVFHMPAVQTDEAPAAVQQPDPQTLADSYEQDFAAEPVVKPHKLAFLKKLLGKRSITIAIAAFCCLGLMGGGYLVWRGFSASSEANKKIISEAEVKARREMRQKEADGRMAVDEALKSITLVDVQQTVLENEKMGSIVVIEGMAKNDFAEPRSLIAVEARLVNEKGEVLASVEQFCGISLNLTQLQVLSKAELLAALNNRINIFATNVNVQPGQSVPFIIVFPKIPDDFYGYEVRPIKAELASPLLNQ